jgi:hypothetical protein
MIFFDIFGNETIEKFTTVKQNPNPLIHLEYYRKFGLKLPEDVSERDIKVLEEKTNNEVEKIKETELEQVFAKEPKRQQKREIKPIKKVIGPRIDNYIIRPITNDLDSFNLTGNISTTGTIKAKDFIKNGAPVKEISMLPRNIKISDNDLEVQGKFTANGRFTVKNNNEIIHMVDENGNTTTKSIDLSRFTIPHPNKDGSIYRANGATNLAADIIRFRHNESKETGIQFDVRDKNADINNPTGHMKITRSSILFGGPNDDKRHLNSAQISAGNIVPDSLNIVGMTSDNTEKTRKVDVFADGGMTVRGNLKLDGDLQINNSNKNVEINRNLAIGHRWNNGDKKDDSIIGKPDADGNFTNGSAFINFKDESNQPLTNNSGTSILFNTNEFAVGSRERMRISANGNVGINNNNPQAKLDVNDNVRVGPSESGNFIIIGGKNRDTTKGEHSHILTTDGALYLDSKNEKDLHLNLHNKRAVKMGGNTYVNGMLKVNRTDDHPWNTGWGNGVHTWDLKVDASADINNLNVRNDLKFVGGNNWIIHTPNDGRHTMYIAPSRAKGNEEWNWGNQTRLEPDGKVFTKDLHSETSNSTTSNVKRLNVDQICMTKKTGDGSTTASVCIGYDNLLFLADYQKEIINRNQALKQVSAQVKANPKMTGFLFGKGI